MYRTYIESDEMLCHSEETYVTPLTGFLGALGWEQYTETGEESMGDEEAVEEENFLNMTLK